MKTRLQQRLSRYDLLSNEGADGQPIQPVEGEQPNDENLVVVAKEDLDAANEARVEAIQTEKEVDAAIDTLEEVSEIVVDLKDTIDTALENVDKMSPMELGKVVGAIEAQAEKLLDETEMPSVDSESDADPRELARIQLESMKEGVAGKKDELVKMHKATADILDKQADTSKTVWIKANADRINDAYSSLSKKSKDAEDETVVVGSKLAAVRALGLTATDLISYAKSITDLNPSSAGKIKADSAARGVVKIKDAEAVKVVRLDGGSITAVGIKSVDNVLGFTTYKSTDVSPKDAGVAVKADLTLAKSYLDAAKAINGELGKLADTIKDENKLIINMLKGDLEDAKLERGGFIGEWRYLLAWLALGPLGLLLVRIFAARTEKDIDAAKKIKLIRARISLTSKYSKDSLNGINALVNELVDVANKIIAAHKDK